MASLSKLGASQHAVRYLLSGPTGTAERSQAEIVADAAPGPLKAFLENIDNDDDWNALNNDPKLTFIPFQQAIASDDSDAALFTWTATAGNRRISIGVGGGSQSWRFDLRFFPSLVE